MNDRVSEGALTTVQTRDDLITVMCASLYPGAAHDSVGMVLGYCEALGLDPMLKPVHIVPMFAKTGRKKANGEDEKGMRDVVLPGIGLYRIQAARTGQYAGLDEPKFGPLLSFPYQAKKTEWVGGSSRDVWVEKTVTYPEWCSVTVYRLVNGFRSAFTAVEFWDENYATASRNTDAPNEMWARRARGQIAKCAEAQALRKGFPEVGSQPTAEEMEGRTFDVEVEATPAPAPVEKPAPRRASEVAQQQAAALTDDRAAQAENTLQTTVPEKKPEPVPAASQAQAPAATQAPAAASSGNVATPTPAEPASPGECANVVRTAQAKKIALQPILAELGFAHLDPATMAGMSKAEFKAVKAKL